MEVCGVNVTHLPPRILGVWKVGESGLEEKGEKLADNDVGDTKAFELF